MDNEFLSQDEVDALLKDVGGETDDGQSPEQNTGEPRSYNLATQERIVRGRMATLEIINERFARLFRIALFNLLRRTAEVSIGPVRILKYSEFIRNLVVPTNLNLVQMKPLRGTALFIFDPTLVFLVVDNMFGGDGRFQTRIEGREFTQTEHRIIQKLLNAVFENLAKSWQSVYPIELEYLRSEMNTTFASIATPNEVVTAYNFTIEVGSATGNFHICMPYAMIEPIRDLLSSSMQGDHMEVDKRWVKLLSREVQTAEVEMVANLGNGSLTLRQIMALKAGDFIALDVADAVTAEVDGVPVLECRYGEFNGQYALKVQKIFDHRNNEMEEELAA